MRRVTKSTNIQDTIIMWWIVHLTASSPVIILHKEPDFSHYFDVKTIFLTNLWLDCHRISRFFFFFFAFSWTGRVMWYHIHECFSSYYKGTLQMSLWLLSVDFEFIKSDILLRISWIVYKQKRLSAGHVKRIQSDFNCGKDSAHHWCQKGGGSSVSRNRRKSLEAENRPWIMSSKEIWSFIL